MMALTLGRSFVLEVSRVPYLYVRIGKRDWYFGR